MPVWEKHIWLPHAVRTNVILAVYEKAKTGDAMGDAFDSAARQRECNARPGSSVPPCAATQTFASEHETHQDVECEFQKMAASFYSHVMHAPSVEHCFVHFPTELACWAEMGLESSLSVMRQGLYDAKRDSLAGLDEMDVFLPMWRTMPLRAGAGLRDPVSDLVSAVCHALGCV